MEVATAGPPFLLLASALLVFLVSTMRLRLWMRALIWTFGVVLLVTGYGLIARNHYGLVALANDAAERGDVRETAFGEAVIANWTAVVGNLAPMFDIMAAFAVLLAIVALLAFTPGEWVERAVRPVILCVLGAIGGAFIALALVASGVGGYAQNRVYAGILRDRDVVDGDTIRMGDVSLRLWGIDAPEYHPGATRPSAQNQYCLSAQGVPTRCGEQARRTLSRLVNGRLVVCRPPPPARANSQAKRADSFGRTMVQCTLHHGALDVDLALAMIEQGYADAYRDESDAEGRYRTAVGLARMQRVGMWAGDMITPDAWRNDDHAREAFIARVRSVGAN